MLAGLTLSACQSTPSSRRVALDIVESLDELPAADRDCMTKVIEDEYSDEELDAIADADGGIDFSGMTTTQMADAASPEWDRFVNDLGKCTGNTVPTDASPPDGSTPTDTSASADTSSSDDTSSDESTDTTATASTDAE